MGDTVIVVSLSGPTLDRLAAMAGEYDTDPDTMLGRLLDRDPHEHPHRCPTCARMAEGHDTARRTMADQHDPLFVVGSEPCGADPYPQ